jgi:hypothetical protein
MLDIKKVYIDTRFKTSDSVSDSDFYVELPLSINIPDKCICYIDDIVLPVSWTMIDSRNNYVYLGLRIGETIHELRVQMPNGNYNGITFASALQTVINSVLTPYSTPVEVSYDNVNNKMTITLHDDRADKVGELEIAILEDDFAATLYKIPLTEVRSINGILMLKNTAVLFPLIAKQFYLDMHTTRNLYLTSTSLGSFNTISNFNCDCIIKKIPVRYNYNEMLFDSAEAGYDYLDLGRQTISRIDFKLLDSMGHVVELNGNHWSFSLVFQER